jgi:hypothetical protein
MLYKNGRVYEGQWDRDQRQGMGFEKFSNLNQFKGEYLNGKLKFNLKERLMAGVYIHGIMVRYMMETGQMG